MSETGSSAFAAVVGPCVRCSVPSPSLVIRTAVARISSSKAASRAPDSGSTPRRFFGIAPAVRRQRVVSAFEVSASDAAKPSDDLLKSNPGEWSRQTLIGNLRSLSTDLDEGVRESSNILVIGGCGALGREVLERFKSGGFPVISVDLAASDVAPENIVLSPGPFPEQAARAVADAEKIFGEKRKCKAIVCVAGGWAGGNAASEGLFETAELMMRQSVHSSLVAAKLATTLLAEDGLLVLTGSAAALQGTPGMLGYGAAKAAVHQLAASLAGAGSGLPAGATVVALAPVVLDTPANRGHGKDTAIHDDWTQLGDVSRLVHGWVTSPKSRPPSGSLLHIATKGFKTEARPLTFGQAP